MSQSSDLNLSEGKARCSWSVSGKDHEIPWQQEVTTVLPVLPKGPIFMCLPGLLFPRKGDILTFQRTRRAMSKCKCFLLAREFECLLPARWHCFCRVWSPAGGTVLGACEVFKWRWLVEADGWWWALWIIVWCGLLPKSFSASYLLT